MSPLHRLREADAQLDDEGVIRATLAPERSEATRMEGLGARAAEAGLPSAAQSALADGLIALSNAIAKHFPENIFWDLDFPVGNVCRRALEQADPTAFVAAQTARLVELQAIYGCHTPIRFRYVHDFTYGFDWAKWVQKDPEARRGVAPFDPTFLNFSANRGHELLALIEADDQKYPQLRDEKHRNPFGFRRDPEAETQLYRHLARGGHLPVETWRWDGAPAWDRPYADDRLEQALALGLGC